MAVNLKQLREALELDKPLLAPGCHDAFSALRVEHSGFETIYAGGFAATASLLGRLDVGLLSSTEMLNHARSIAQALNIPVIADVDIGYGNAINVTPTVHEYEQAGVAAIHLEDQKSRPSVAAIWNRSRSYRPTRWYKRFVPPSPREVIQNSFSSPALILSPLKV